jgi:hypothetical protein
MDTSTLITTKAHWPHTGVLVLLLYPYGRIEYNCTPVLGVQNVESFVGDSPPPVVGFKKAHPLKIISRFDVPLKKNATSMLTKSEPIPLLHLNDIKPLVVRQVVQQYDKTKYSGINPLPAWDPACSDPSLPNVGTVVHPCTFFVH